MKCKPPEGLWEKKLKKRTTRMSRAANLSLRLWPETAISTLGQAKKQVYYNKLLII